MTAATPSAAPSGDGRLAFLIVAHRQPDHLARLVHALDGPGCHIFIHVDRKSPLPPFTAAVPKQRNVVFLEDRLEVTWGKLGVVQATLALIDLALASGRAFRYFTLLSGSDYPIKPIGDIVARPMIVRPPTYASRPKSDGRSYRIPPTHPPRLPGRPIFRRADAIPRKHVLVADGRLYQLRPRFPQ